MNDKSILESAARELCHLRGQDPDEMVGHGAEPNKGGWVPDVLISSPRWVLAARELEDFDRLACALSLLRAK